MGLTGRAAGAVIALLLLLSCDEIVTKMKSNDGSATAAAESARLESERVRAIALAREAHSLVNDRLYIRPPSSEVLTNDFQIRRMMSEIKGDLTIHGWQAVKWDDDTYVVSFSYDQGGDSRGWPFEVQLSGGVVRYIIGDDELEKKYGWGTGR